MKHKLESRLPGEISIISDIQMTPPYGRKRRGNKEPLMKVKEESEKAGLNLKIQKEEDVCLRTADSLCCTAETNTTL